MADKLQGDNSIDGGGSSSAAGKTEKANFCKLRESVATMTMSDNHELHNHGPTVVVA